MGALKNGVTLFYTGMSLLGFLSTDALAVSQAISVSSVYTDGRTSNILSKCASLPDLPLKAELANALFSELSPSRSDCNTAIKLLTQYERLANKLGIQLGARRLAELNRKRDAGTITSYDLPGFIGSQMPGIFKGKSVSAQ
jgi:hypothetical protein